MADPHELPLSLGDLLDDLKLLIRSRYGIIFLRTNEKERATTLLRHLADQLDRPHFTWARSTGLKRMEADNGIYNTETIQQALQHISSSQQSSIYELRVLPEELQQPLIHELMERAAQPLTSQVGALVVVGSEIDIPEPLRPLSALLELPVPGMHDYQDLLRHILRDVSNRMDVTYDLTSEDLGRLLANLRGLTLMEAEKILTKAIVEDGTLDAKDLEAVVSAKRQIVEKEGLLEYFPFEESLAEIAGLGSLKRWLRQRRELIVSPERAESFGLEFPKGILLVGVPGCGKSLCAKAVATEWKMPLLRFDPSQLYNKYIGETEKNFRRAISTAERISPVVLWIDEIEKAFGSSGGEGDGGTSTRMLGSFLSWMQERSQPIFVVATANDVDRLPPEFLRKGRFDEIFFVDLPDEETRRAILQIHLEKRKRDPEAFDLTRLTTTTEGFSGAEIEQAIVAALFAAFSERVEVSTRHILDELGHTRPLAKTMAGRIERLRAWADGKVRTAS